MSFTKANLASTWKRNFSDTKKIDILCGSLVLHDLLGTQIQEHLPKLLEILCAVMSSDGVVFFGDVFQANSETTWDKELQQWQKCMRNEGMLPEQISQFMDLNPEMRYPVTQRVLSEMAERYGFATDWINLPHQHQEHCPFKGL